MPEPGVSGLAVGVARYSHARGSSQATSEVVIWRRFAGAARAVTPSEGGGDLITPMGVDGAIYTS